MQTSTELLSAILQVVGKIEQNQSQAQAKARTGRAAATGTGSIASMLGPGIAAFKGAGPKSTKNFFSFVRGMLEIAKESKDRDVQKVRTISESMGLMGDSLPRMAEGLSDLGKIRTQRVNRALMSLDMLYTFMEEKGDARSTRKVERAVKTFEKMGKALKDIARPIKDITMGFAYLGLGILAFAGSLLLTSLILKLGKPTDVLIFMGAAVLGIVMLFGVLALSRRIVDRGTDTIKDIGLGMAALSLGILAFALSIKILPMILGSESGGSIAKSLLIMFGIVAVAVGMFALIGLASGLIKKGVGVVFLMSLGMLVLSVAIVGMATAAKYLMGGALTVGPQDMAGDEKDENKRMVLRGLGTLGLIILASIATFALLGIPVVAGLVLTGVGVAIGMSAALLLLTKAVVKLYEAGKQLQGEPVAKTIGDLISGTLEGFLDGISSLSGGKRGVRGAAEFIKNSAKIFAATGVLLSMSVALSQFAKALTAFAELENMRVIEGYDDEGKPIFGPKINIKNVGSTISTTISDFLIALITSTDGLTRQQAGAIKKMGRALTGKRGILSGVIQFADALKVYAEFGANNEIGYVDYDDEGNEIRKKVKASVVVDNMIGSFLYFTTQLFDKSEAEFGDGEPGISGRQKRRMRRMSKALIGKHGILGAVMQFSETLQMFAKFGADNKLPIFDAEGKPTGEYVTVGQIADNIVKTLTTFSDTLADKLEKGKVKDASKALAKYDKMIEKLAKLSNSLDGLTKVSASIKDLSDNIGDLAVNVDKLDTSKLQGLTGSIIMGDIQNATAPRTTRRTGTTPSVAATRTATRTNEPDWDTISAQIGNAVGAQIASAIKQNQLKFVFSNMGTNEGILELG